ncbi:hypothetical protein [Ruminiclostridium cellulolyticum]|uniref:Uncharacterized protein n=1 Tax=Ruminiclostridium cellulolyticum (strain ATCC 35319 / DSM 5812 / JCM 6584 / H10) TaxID=394503 RepID=B8I4Q5_RUMCH|nr:hypothetical protein [Ruminiclostridium cellulolyticum]ACL76559.1 hypothetical protein Ccel_2217 [Ruminiclostridium cellulolyticum H10]
MPWNNEFTIENEYGVLTTYSGEGISWYPNGDNSSPDAHITMLEDGSFHVSVPRQNGRFNSHIYFYIRGKAGPQEIQHVDEENVPEDYKIDGRIDLTPYLELAQRFWASAWYEE